MARKTAEDAQKTRDQILNGAEQVLLQKGVTLTTMGEIADAAGVSRGAVYGHYPSKIDVCRALCRRTLASPELRFSPQSAEPLTALVQSGRYYLQLFTEPGPVQRLSHILFYRCEYNLDHAQLLRYRDFISHAAYLYSLRLLRRAQRQDLLPAELDLRLANLYLHTVFDGAYDRLTWFYAEKPQAGLPDSEKLLHAAVQSLSLGILLR